MWQVTCNQGQGAEGHTAHLGPFCRRPDLQVAAAQLAYTRGRKLGDVAAESGPVEHGQRGLISWPDIIVGVLSPIVGVPIHTRPVYLAIR